MTSPSRATMFRLLAFGVLVLSATSWAQTRPPILEKVAKAYGLDSLGKLTRSATPGMGKSPAL